MYESRELLMIALLQHSLRNVVGERSCEKAFPMIRGHESNRLYEKRDSSSLERHQNLSENPNRTSSLTMTMSIDSLPVQSRSLGPLYFHLACQDKKGTTLESQRASLLFVVLDEELYFAFSRDSSMRSLLI
jgi:hypothetical protein